jgi:hypothetical protein
MEKYLTKNNLYGMIVINSLSDEHEKNLLIKHCLKYFTLMTATTIDTAEDMSEFVSKHGTLLSVIRVYSENKESMEKLKGGTKVTPPEGKKTQLEILTAKLANLSHDKLQQMISNIGSDGSVNTKMSDHKGTVARRPNKIDANVVQAHMASGTVTDNGKTYFPINRTGLKYPLYATINNCKLKKEVTAAEGIWTLADGKPFSYEAYKDSSSLGESHFSGNNQCKRCKGFGHFFQRCLNESI